MEWTDKLVIEFTREASKGTYGIFKNAPKIEDKIKIFKNLQQEKYEALKKKYIISVNRTLNSF